MHESSEPLVYRPKGGWGSVVLAFAGWLAFDCLLWLLIGLAIQNQQSGAQVYGLVGIGVVFTLLLFIPVYILLSRSRQIIVIQNDGLVQQRPLHGPRFFAWPDISQVRLGRNPKGGLYASITTRDKRKLYVWGAWLPARDIAQEVSRRSGIALLGADPAPSRDNATECKPRG